MSTFSLCMIVRNEEATLGRCLDSVTGIFDEIVIVDTGSEDRTREIAADAGARLVDFAWIDDFAAARNVSFARATGEYLMWLDADDVLLQEDRAKLLELKASLAPEIDAVSMLYHTAFDAGGNVIASNRRLRIVRRSKGFSWVGSVHEDLVSSETFTYLDTDIVVTHRKPGAESGPSKRNLLILEKLIAGGVGVRPVDVFNYARELEMHKEFERAVPYYEEFLASDQADPEVRLFALHKLASCYYMSGRPDREWECTLRSFDIDIPRPEFSCRVAERFLARNQFSQAAFWYQIAATSVGTPSAWSIDNHAFRTWLPHKQLGLCYYQLGDYQRSLHHNREAQKFQPDDPDIRTNIGVLEALIRESPSPADVEATSVPVIQATVCVPWRPTPDRIAGHQRARDWWIDHGFAVIEADSDVDKPFLCNQARNNAVRRAATDIVVLADGDTIPADVNQIHAAVRLVAAGQADVVWPFTVYRHLPASAVTATDLARVQPVQEYHHGSPGGIIVFDRAKFWSIGGYDEGFVPGAWAWDDTAFMYAAQTLLRVARMTGIVYSFDHDVDNAGTPGRDLDASPNKVRFKLYERAFNNPDLMRELVGR